MLLFGPNSRVLCLIGLSLVFATFASACANDKTAGQGATLPVCARNDALALKLGCAPLGDRCEPPPAACDALADAWFTCVERDLRQCICEQDDAQLNCEGSFKPDEGPARCIEQYRAFDDCIGDEHDDK